MVRAAQLKMFWVTELSFHAGDAAVSGRDVWPSRSAENPIRPARSRSTRTVRKVYPQAGNLFSCRVLEKNGACFGSVRCWTECATESLSFCGKLLCVQIFAVCATEYPHFSTRCNNGRRHAQCHQSQTKKHELCHERVDWKQFSKIHVTRCELDAHGRDLTEEGRQGCVCAKA